MRIAVVNHSRRKVGGAEIYLDSVFPALAHAGHDLACLYEDDPPSASEPIALPPGTPAYSAGELGGPQACDQLKRWQPDLVYCHGLTDPGLECRVLGLAPNVLYVHNYYGTCISGDKLHNIAQPVTCERRFGPACLLHYFPDHCGGRNPLTMLSLYRRQSQRLDLMSHYTALVTNSHHMVRELDRHHLKADCVYPFLPTSTPSKPPPVAFAGDTLSLLFAGRMTSLKGGRYLLAALPQVQASVNRKIHVTFAGDGPDRASWQLEAAALASSNLSFDFPGWLNTPGLQGALSRSHLLIFPSIWPEPFGLSGLEAGLYGVPTIAFAVGGIPEWLRHNVNGHLAPAPPTVAGLAEAITSALICESHYEVLRSGAREQARRFTLDQHISSLTDIFERCLA